MAPFSLVAIYSLVIALTAQAAPSLQSRQTALTILGDTQVAAFKPFADYAAASYCQSSKILNWNCGPHCTDNPAFQPVAAGGDGSDTQFWFVGFDPIEQTVVVSHQGTNPAAIVSLLTDINIVRQALDASLFPGIGDDIQVHSGFASAHAKTANDVLSAVQSTLSSNNVSTVTIVGHSLGAALALLDGVFLPLHLPDVNFSVIGYGTPRVGNEAFADYVDAHVNVSRVNNKEDPIPIMPGRLLGYSHPSGEKHIQDDETWIACPGQDNTDALCTTGDVTDILSGVLADHNGPYDGVSMKSPCH
ncbi:alpha/beta-hydrolase [Pluteus cervinus]|uniref:Alpha/beta-hydrolase n=1 Tax=Pluteus cervinus TaxID=181527 RepID=A0ACD3AU48_9AGAR|nr:alpha/beta-hydrolase [Pluteus cervinus]